MMNLKTFDIDIFRAIESEQQRQNDHIELIASENYTHPLVMAVQGSCLTNKYAEGYPGKRYYSGCVFVDDAENLAIERAKALFGAEHVNVQPHSGSQANAAAYLALLSPGDTILGMSLDAGGHLTHGAKPSFSGKIYNAVHYGVDLNTGLIDYQAVESLAQTHRPKVIVAGFSAYSRAIDWAKFRAIADAVGAFLLVDMSHVSGLVAAGLYQNPLPHAHVVTTTTHKSLRGPRGGVILSSCGDENLYKKLNSAVFPGVQGGPLMHVVAAKAVAFKMAMSDDFKNYQKQVIKNSKAMSEVFQKNDVPVFSGGTDNHLFLLDLSKIGLTGKKLCDEMESVGIVANKNSIPGDVTSPTLTSGVRIGTCAVTTRGFGVAECTKVADQILALIHDIDSTTLKIDIRKEVAALCASFPLLT